jgi:RND family efflux transporter MFP subunit
MPQRRPPRALAGHLSGISKMDQLVRPEFMVQKSPRRWSYAAAVGAAIIGIVALGGWMLRTHTAAAVKPATPLPLVSVVTPSFGQVSASVALTGLISARNDMPIGTEGDAGRIAEVLVEAGDRVHKGQILARLNPITGQSGVDSADASLAEARANAAVAQAEWKRAEQGPDLFSQEEDDRRHTTALAAEAKVKAAEAQLVDMRNRLAHTTVLAPTDGIVLTRTAEVGQIAVPGTTVLFRLARDGQVEMRGQVSEQDLPKLKVGQPVQVRLDGVARSFDGQVWQIGAVIDPTTRLGTVRIELPADNRDLRPGAFARAEVHVDSVPGVLLPQTAVLSDDQGNYVLIVGAEDKLQRRAVTVAGARPEGLLVSAGLDGRERVIAIAGAFLRAGEAVQIAAPHT